MPFLPFSLYVWHVLSPNSPKIDQNNPKFLPTIWALIAFRSRGALKKSLYALVNLIFNANLPPEDDENHYSRELNSLFQRAFLMYFSII